VSTDSPIVPSSDGSQLLFVNPSTLQDAWFLGTETKSREKDGLQQNLKAGTPTIEKTTTTGKLTCQQRMTRAQCQKLQTATTGPTGCKVEEHQTSEQPRRARTASAGPQLFKVESNRNQNHGTNQRTRIEHSNSDDDNERNCIATHMYNNHLTLPDLLGGQLRLSGPLKGIGLCKHLRKYAAWQAYSLKSHNNKEKITHSNMVENVFYPTENAKGNI
jgi:hypothetical protein